jgi:uncharacterized protein YbjT (DUF2867 family)
MNILILGAAGRISRLVTKHLLSQTEHQLVLFARKAHDRIKITAPERIRLLDGDFKSAASLNEAMKGVDLVYLNAMDDTAGLKNILAAMEQNNVTRFIGASILGIYDEVEGAFGAWNKRMVGSERIKLHAANASLVEASGLNYTILRLTWLYDQVSNRKYRTTNKGEPFKGSQVTREAVSQLIVDIIQDNSKKYFKTSLGVSEPDTDWNKPSFY